MADESTQKPVLLRIAGKPDLFLAEKHKREEGRVHGFGRWRHREGANNETVRLVGVAAWYSWPSHMVEIRPL